MKRNITIKEIKLLVKMLNQYRDDYYNRQKSLVSDYEYDELFDRLKYYEETTGFVLSNSPTQTVGYEVKSELKKIKHNHPMLSLDKTKSIDDLKNFLKDKFGILMLKLDGLTISLRYLNGELVSAETRGNGEVGEDVLHNVKTFSNIPLHINYDGELIIDGEAIITYDTFHKINNSLPDGKKYSCPRNLASGSVRQLDSKVASKRDIKFIAWKMVNEDYKNFYKQLDILDSLGFDVVPYCGVYSSDINDELINKLKNQAEIESYPIDGMVLGYDDIEYGKSLGATGHHLKSQIAFKFYDEEAVTVLRYIDWTVGKTGVITPTAVFEPVEIDGTVVERASVHNLSILNKLNLMSGDKITVYKANQIIPQISKNLSDGKRDNYINIPARCPVCGERADIVQENDTKILVCTNDNCKGKLLGKLTHFVSRDAMNIEGLSEATLEKFIDNEWLTSFIDIYGLYRYKDEISQLEGFGDKSTDKLLTAIENSKNTTLDKFLYALSIPNVGKSVSKTISDYFNGDFDEFHMTSIANFNFDWTILPDIGQTLSNNINKYLKQNYMMIGGFTNVIKFEIKDNINVSNKLNNKTFCVTGSLNIYPNRNKLVEDIENNGGKCVGSVSKKTNYLLTNDTTSGSSKNIKAKELGIPIITEEEFIGMIK